MRYAAGAVLMLGLTVQAWADQDPMVPLRVKAKVEAINHALIKGDYGTIADLTYPKLVEMMGGREAMLAALSRVTVEMKAKGFVFKSVTVEEPKQFVPMGSEVFTVVPVTLMMTAPGGRVTSKGFVLGISEDAGQSWTFIDGNVGRDGLETLVPNLPLSLKIPEKSQPVFVKE